MIPQDFEVYTQVRTSMNDWEYSGDNIRLAGPYLLDAFVPWDSPKSDGDAGLFRPEPPVIDQQAA